MGVGGKGQVNIHIKIHTKLVLHTYDFVWSRTYKEIQG